MCFTFALCFFFWFASCLCTYSYFFLPHAFFHSRSELNPVVGRLRSLRQLDLDHCPLRVLPVEICSIGPSVLQKLNVTHVAFMKKDDIDLVPDELPFPRLQEVKVKRRVLENTEYCVSVCIYKYVMPVHVGFF